ncbi:hypothetical protein BKA65DRAFT_489558 [Rhexocercosporidium sp. MPI-PUGE-AT-0058]|nr:hypothetical protein BKA65DRAFT_489558 [Rhexocercosporidium sp. MPI-PUGE-AT-0058]
MNNAADAPLRVPGFGGLPIYHQIDPFESLNDGTAGWRQCPRLTARELAMLALMNLITDKENWHVDIFDEGTVANWRLDASISKICITLDEQRIRAWGEQKVPAMPLISETAWRWCIKELRDKAVSFHQNGFIRVLDAGSCVCKSDSLASTDILAKFDSSVAHVRQESRYQYRQADGITDLVDPSMYPLYYSRTRVLTSGGVGLDDCVESCFSRNATVASAHPWPPLREELAKYIQERHCSLSLYNDDDFHRYYSSTFQWLPCEIKYTKQKEAPIHITSYINNLHPSRNKPLYKVIERIIASSIPLWSNSLFKGNSRHVNGGPAPIRIRTYGYDNTEELPLWLDTVAEDMRELWKVRSPEEGSPNKKFKDYVWKLYDFLRYPVHKTQLLQDLFKDEITSMNIQTFEDWYGSGISYETSMSLLAVVEEKRDFMIAALQPEPGTAFSYEDWKEGKNGKVIVGPPDFVGRNRVPMQTPDPDQGLYTIDLQEILQQKGLQIIIRIREVDLIPSNPTFTGSLMFEAQRNEHIVSTAAYIYSSSNVTTPQLSFCQPTWMHPLDYHFGDGGNMLDDDHAWDTQRRLFGFVQSAEARIHYDWSLHTPPWQTLGTVDLPINRLLTWPNTLQHRLDGLSLCNATQPGRFGMLLLYLVDPNYRICSTANVPPQQHDWWAEVALDQGVFRKGAIPQARKVPSEVREMVDRFTAGCPMGEEEAEEIKFQVEEDRAAALSEAMVGMPCGFFDPTSISL